VQALDDVDLTVRRGSTVALVGRSGSGKSTLARCLMRLEEPSAGEILFDAQNILKLSKAEVISFRKKIQLIFQDSASAFNPRFTMAEIVEEPLRIHRRGAPAEQRERALFLMEQVGLQREWAEKLALELSGGQRQRLAIARALALQPELLILDEALSGSDLSIQAQVVNLLVELQEQHSLTYLLITHDLALAGHLADEIAVMHEGRIVEQARTSALFTNPQHAESRSLLAALPIVQTEFALLSL
jgi:ABC-type oligopeptide transport system ATPase subunit